jgi:type II secretory pathway component PulF
MQRFRFRARSQEGQLRKGIVEAQSTNSAAQVLRDQKLIIIEIHEIGESKSIFSFGQKVKFEDVVNFTRQLSTMIRSWLAINRRSFDPSITSPPTLQTKSLTFWSIEGGSTFAQALSHHSDTFRGLYRFS